MYWGWDQALLFVGVWSIGAIGFALSRRATRSTPAFRRSLIQSLILATTFTPTVLPFHGGVAIVPAIHTLVVSPFVPAYGLGHALVFGALPVTVVSLVLIGIRWAQVKKNHGAA